MSPTNCGRDREFAASVRAQPCSDTLFGLILADEYHDRYGDEGANRPYENTYFGRTVLASARFKR